MNTVLTSARVRTRERLDEIADLGHDTRIPLTDRIAVRLGLWLLQVGIDRAERRERRDAHARHRLAVETRARAEREAAWVRAAQTCRYR